MTLTPEQRAFRAKQLLEDEVLQEILTTLEQDTIREVKTAPTTDALVAARAKLVAIADIPKALEVIRDRQFVTARSERRAPLA